MHHELLVTTQIFYPINNKLIRMTFVVQAWYVRFHRLLYFRDLHSSVPCLWILGLDNGNVITFPCRVCWRWWLSFSWFGIVQETFLKSTKCVLTLGRLMPLRKTNKWSMTTCVTSQSESTIFTWVGVQILTIACFFMDYFRKRKLNNHSIVSGGRGVDEAWIFPRTTIWLSQSGLLGISQLWNIKLGSLHQFILNNTMK